MHFPMHHWTLNIFILDPPPTSHPVYVQMFFVDDTVMVIIMGITFINLVNFLFTTECAINMQAKSMRISERNKNAFGVRRRRRYSNVVDEPKS